MAVALTAVFMLVAIAVVVSMLRALVTLVTRLLAAACLAAIAGLVVGVVTETRWPGAGAPAGLLTTLLSFIPSALIVWRLSSSRASPNSGKGRARIPDQSGTPRAVFPRKDRAVESAWDRAEEVAPAYAVELRQSRAACARLLTLQSTSATLDPEIIETCTLIRRHVPELVEQTARACDGASPEEAAALRASLAARLQDLSSRAAELTENARLAAREDLAIRHAHLANQLRTMDAGPLQTGAPAQDRQTSRRGVPGWPAWLWRPVAFRR
jgi:hypothetical protein